MRHGSHSGLFNIMAVTNTPQAQSQSQAGIAVLNQRLNSDAIQKKFADMLGKKSVGFLTSVSNVVTNNDLLKKADTNSIILAAAQAAALDLPINPNLGYAAIVPFNDVKNKRCMAQFQLMRDGFVELALRTGQVVALVNEVVYEGELVKCNRFRDEYEFDESKRVSDKVIGYMAYAKLSNGFEKTIYWDVNRCKEHALKYSQTFKKGYGLWKESFDSMALKTTLKHLIKKYLPKSIEMMRAVEYDGAAMEGTIENPIIKHSDENPSVENANYEEVKDIDPDATPEEETPKAPSEEKVQGDERPADPIPPKANEEEDF
jgi:recombination protein RecT